MKSRRDFLNIFKKSEVELPLIVRPPYNIDESLFQKQCIICENKACVTSCDEKIIFIDQNGSPNLDFSKSGCTFCEDCAKACPKGVLSLENNTLSNINAIFSISLDKCVAHNGVICFSCKEPCIDDAILFNGMFNPIIDMDKCTSCGFCVARCPTEAIVIKGI